MTERRQPQDPAVAARLAAHDEKLNVLQRERREDRDEARRAIEAVRQELREDIGEMRTAILDSLKSELAPVVSTANEAKAKADRNDQWIRDVKLQGAVWALAFMTFGGAIFALVKLLWGRVQIQ